MRRQLVPEVEELRGQAVATLREMDSTIATLGIRQKAVEKRMKRVVAYHRSQLCNEIASRRERIGAESRALASDALSYRETFAREAAYIAATEAASQTTLTARASKAALSRAAYDAFVSFYEGYPARLSAWLKDETVKWALSSQAKHLNSSREVLNEQGLSDQVERAIRGENPPATDMPRRTLSARVRRWRQSVVPLYEEIYRFEHELDEFRRQLSSGRGLFPIVTAKIEDEILAALRDGVWVREQLVTYSRELRDAIGYDDYIYTREEFRAAARQRVANALRLATSLINLEDLEAKCAMYADDDGTYERAAIHALRECRAQIRNQLRLFPRVQELGRSAITNLEASDLYLWRLPPWEFEDLQSKDSRE